MCLHIICLHTVCSLKLSLPKDAKKGHIISGLDGFSLISVVTLYNAGCEVKCITMECIRSHYVKVILEGYKFSRTGIWLLPLDQELPKPKEEASHMIQEMMTGVVETML